MSIVRAGLILIALGFRIGLISPSEEPDTKELVSRIGFILAEYFFVGISGLLAFAIRDGPLDSFAFAFLDDITCCLEFTQFMYLKAYFYHQLFCYFT